MKKFLTLILSLSLFFSPKISRGQDSDLDIIQTILSHIEGSLSIIAQNSESLWDILSYSDDLSSYLSHLKRDLTELEVIASLGVDDEELFQYIQEDIEWLRLYLDEINVFNFEERLWDYLYYLQTFYEDIYGEDEFELADETLFEYLTGLPVEVINNSLPVEVVNWEDLWGYIGGVTLTVAFADDGSGFPSLDFDYSYLENVDILSSILLNRTYTVSGYRYYWDLLLDKDNTPDDVYYTSYYENSLDWFSAVNHQLSLLLDGQNEAHQTALTILWKLCANDDDADEFKDEVEARSSELSLAINDFSRNDPSSYLGFSPPRILEDNKFSGASSEFYAECPEELTLDLQYFIPSSSFSGSDFRYQFNIDLSPYQSFFTTCRTVALVMWWLVSFVFSFFVFRLIYKSCASCSFYFLKITGNL